MTPNGSLPPPPPSNASVHTSVCLSRTSTLSVVVFSFFLLTNLLLLLFFAYVLYLCYQRWRHQPAARPSAASCSNVFMYHYITMQLLTFAGFTCYVCGGFVGVSELRVEGVNLWATCALGQAMFNSLTCLEHYLAVVHPIVYVGLRRAGETRVRNLSTGCVWLLSLGWLLVNCFLSFTTLYVILYCCVMAAILASICVCSVLVLRTLKRPGGAGERADRSKRRSFQTITLILGVMLFKFGGNLTGILIAAFKAPDPGNDCLLLLLAFWIDLPSSLVLPLLFLHRVGRLPCWRQRNHTEEPTVN